VIEIGRLRINPNTREVHINGRLVILTPTEYSILYHLAKNVGRVLTHQVLVNKVWGNEAVDDHHLLTVHINNLRSKLGDTGQESSMILTERGVGYRLAKETPIPQL
jgi:DNA-binding response OmpR family regulator